jgi:hypothetical protein
MVKSDMCEPGKSRITLEILAYLDEHPKAQDTFEGIVQWWLLERKIRCQTAIVKEAIAELVKKGFLLEDRLRDSHKHYKVNQRKSGEIKAFLRKKLDEIKKERSCKRTNL